MELDQAEACTTSVADLVDAVTARATGEDASGQPTFTTTTPDWWAGGRTFGGMIVAQALSAALQTVPSGLEIHSLHGYFLRPVRSQTRTVHTVEKVRDGRSFSIRAVVSASEGREAFRMTASFHAPEEGDEYQLPAGSDVPPPMDLAGVEAPFFFDVRELGATERREDGTFASTRRCWFRVREPLPDDPAVHACLLAYFSDMTGAAFRPGSMGAWGTHTDTSLDHAVWFHRPWRADAWSFFDLQALVNAGGRATIRATMRGDDGTLHLSMAQELLIRRLDEPRRVEAPPWVSRDVPEIWGGNDGPT